MKYFGVILVVLATAFIHQNEASPSTSLDRLKQDVNNTVAFLRSYKTDLAVDGDKKFDDALNAETARIAGAANQTLQRIQNAVEEANNDGKNAGECYDSAESDVNDAESRVLSVVQKCFEDNKPDWTNVQNGTEVRIENGEKILERFDEIKKECANSTHEEICVVLKLPEAAATVGLYKFSVGQLKKEVAATTTAGFKAVASCGTLPVITFKVELKNARHNADECIDSADTASTTVTADTTVTAGTTVTADTTGTTIQNVIES